MVILGGISIWPHLIFPLYLYIGKQPHPTPPYPPFKSLYWKATPPYPPPPPHFHRLDPLFAGCSSCNKQSNVNKLFGLKSLNKFFYHHSSCIWTNFWCCSALRGPNGVVFAVLSHKKNHQRRRKDAHSNINSTLENAFKWPDFRRSKGVSKKDLERCTWLAK